MYLQFVLSQFKDIQLCNSRNFLSPRLTRMRDTKDRVMLFFCEATNRKIENLDTKTSILKNLSIRTAGMAQILQEGASLKIFHKKTA